MYYVNFANHAVIQTRMCLTWNIRFTHKDPPGVFPRPLRKNLSQRTHQTKWGQLRSVMFSRRSQNPMPFRVCAASVQSYPRKTVHVHFIVCFARLVSCVVSHGALKGKWHWRLRALRSPWQPTLAEWARSPWWETWSPGRRNETTRWPTGCRKGNGLCTPSASTSLTRGFITSLPRLAETG